MISFLDALTFAKDYPAVLSLVTFVVGLSVGNRQAIGRDKRKEFNDTTEDAFVALTAQIRALDEGGVRDSVGDLLLVESYIPLYKRWLFRIRVEQYKSAQSGISIYDVETLSSTPDPKKLKRLAACAKKLRWYLRRR
jgi:hypothetical protein